MWGIRSLPARHLDSPQSRWVLLAFIVCLTPKYPRRGRGREARRRTCMSTEGKSESQRLERRRSKDTATPAGMGGGGFNKRACIVRQLQLICFVRRVRTRLLSKRDAKSANCATSGGALVDRRRASQVRRPSKHAVLLGFCPKWASTARILQQRVANSGDGWEAAVQGPGPDTQHDRVRSILGTPTSSRVAKRCLV